MENTKFKELTSEIYEMIFDSFEEFDPDEVEADLYLDNVTITFANGTRFVVNRQVPVSQLWLATKRNGYHFNYQEESGSWVCDKTAKDFWSIFSQEVSEVLGREFSLNSVKGAALKDAYPPC